MVGCSIRRMKAKKLCLQRFPNWLIYPRPILPCMCKRQTQSSLKKWLTLEVELSLSRRSSSEYLVKEALHLDPRPLVRLRVVHDPPVLHVGLRVGKAVHRVPIGVELPVGLGVGHFLGEGEHLFRGSHRVVVAVHR